MASVTVSPSTDVETASSVLAQAFAEDPVVRWLMPEPDRDHAMFRAIIRYGHGSPPVLDVATRDGEPVGAALWEAPGTHLGRIEQMRYAAASARALRGAVPRAMAVEAACARARPEQPHWYLAQLGAAVPGVGAGRALLDSRLSRIDGPAYLESSNEVNIPLYERFGFRVTEEIVVPDGGPTLWGMLRP